MKIRKETTANTFQQKQYNKRNGVKHIWYAGIPACDYGYKDTLRGVKIVCLI